MAQGELQRAKYHFASALKTHLLQLLRRGVHIHAIEMLASTKAVRELRTTGLWEGRAERVPSEALMLNQKLVCGSFCLCQGALHDVKSSTTLS